MDIVTGILFLIVFLAVDIVIFLALRQFVLWYFRINEVADNIAYIASYLQRQERGHQTNAMAYPAPALPSTAPSFKPITAEQDKRLRKGWD